MKPEPETIETHHGGVLTVGGYGEAEGRYSSLVYNLNDPELTLVLDLTERGAKDLRDWLTRWLANGEGSP